MDVETARETHDALVRTWHPRNDYRTDEAKGYTVWMDENVRSYVASGASLLDLGCATGKMTLKAESFGVRATGIDCSGEALLFAREVAADIGSDARFVQGDFSHLPFADGSFDTVLFPRNIILCSYEEMARIAEEVARVLRCGGRFILTMRDELEHTRTQSRTSPYEASTGRMPGSLSLPDGQTYDYPTYLWTVAFAAHVVGRWLHVDRVSEIGKNLHILVFVNG